MSVFKFRKYLFGLVLLNENKVPFFSSKCPNDFRHYCPIRTDMGVRTKTALVSDSLRFLHNVKWKGFYPDNNYEAPEGL